MLIEEYYRHCLDVVRVDPYGNFFCMRQQSAKCLHCPVVPFNFYVCPLQQVLFNNVAAETCSLRCDVDKWAITGAIFMCHICGRHDLRLALLMLNVRCESCACQYRRLGRQRGPFWHVIHHWFHSAATAVSLSPSHRPLTPLRTHQQDDQISLWDKRQPSCFTDKARGQKNTLFLHILCHSDIFINKQLLMAGSKAM